MLRYCNISKALSWDVIGFLSVVAVVVYLDYFGLFGFVKMYRHCLRMIKGNSRFVANLTLGFIFSCHKDFVLFLFLIDILKKRWLEKFRKNTTLILFVLVGHN